LYYAIKSDPQNQIAKKVYSEECLINFAKNKLANNGQHSDIISSKVVYLPGLYNIIEAIKIQRSLSQTFLKAKYLADT